MRVLAVVRWELDREQRTVSADGQPVAVKVGRLAGEAVNVVPEHEDVAVKSTWSSVVTTMSAPASATRSASSPRAIPIAAMSPALAASTPAAASSMTTACSGATPNSRAAVRNISGSGFP